MRVEDRTLGVVLAGGQSRRMGTVDKTLLPLCGIPMVKRVLDRIRPQVDEVIINSNADASLFAAFGAPVLGDVVPGYAGPLAGVLTALEHADAHGFRHVCSVAADTPFFPSDFTMRLKDKPDHDIVLASYNGFRQPTFGLWSVELVKPLRDFLTQGDDRKIMRFVQQHSWACVAFDSDPENGPDPFFNVNTPEDLKLAERHVNNYECDHG
jgi:molybdopterin-guanine dinucleotide biosynthesis protein A